MVEFLLLLVVSLILGFLGTSLPVSATVLAVYTLGLLVADGSATLVILLSLLATALLALLSVKPIRTRWLSRPFLDWFRKIAPTMSDTEREALEAGTVWWDAEIFSGNPDWNRLLATPAPVLREDEQAFLDGPVEELCAMLNDWEIEQRGDLSEQVWQFLRDQRFFSMVIDKEHGGLGFTAYGNSAVVTKIASCNLVAAVTVMVPNSLGPGELLRDFGTEEQQRHYLPRLASGEDIPCFALTGPSAGSDAASMPDTGIVCRGEWQGEETLGLRLTWNKRYITLAPVATVLGLAFNTYDPDHLLGEKDDLGITCALIPTDTPGVVTGNRHFPVGAMFMNGPTRGNDVFIPLSYVIGGEERIGQGWRMLMHSLAAGRAISLPALGTAAVKYSARYSGEYARIRRQFGVPIAYFEGVEEPLGRLAGEAYRVDAARLLTLSGLALGEKPSVLSAILKYYATEANRRCVNDAMDIHGGKGIITGPGNYLASIYTSLPIAITVEGANILTRSLIVFGQGAIRNHPYLQDEMALAKELPSAQVVTRFDEVLFSHIGFVVNNLCRTLVFGLSGARLAEAPDRADSWARYYRQTTRLCSAFAFVADLVLLSLGGAFKFREKLSGRLADVLIHLYLASAILKRHDDNGYPGEDRALVEWGLEDSLFRAQQALIATLDNLPSRLIGKITRRLVFPLGLPHREPADQLGKDAARILYATGPTRDRLLTGIFEPGDDRVTAKLSRAFEGVLALHDVEKRLKEQAGEELTIDNYRELADNMRQRGLLSDDEANLVIGTYELVREVINVDDFESFAARRGG